MIRGVLSRKKPTKQIRRIFDLNWSISMIWDPATVYDFYIYIYMSLLFASDIIDYLLHWQINLQS